LKLEFQLCTELWSNTSTRNQKEANMSAAKFSITNHGAVLAPDVNDPNTTPPPKERIFVIPRPPSVAPGIWLAAEGDTPTIELWAQLTPRRWFRLAMWSFGGAQTFELLADGAFICQPGDIVADVPLFVRITTPSNATAIHIGMTTS